MHHGIISTGRCGQGAGGCADLKVDDVAVSHDVESLVAVVPVILCEADGLELVEDDVVVIKGIGGSATVGDWIDTQAITACSRRVGDERHC